MPHATSTCFRTKMRLSHLTSQKNVIGKVQNLKCTLVFQNTTRFFITRPKTRFSYSDNPSSIGAPRPGLAFHVHMYFSAGVASAMPTFFKEIF